MPPESPLIPDALSIRTSSDDWICLRSKQERPFAEYGKRCCRREREKVTCLKIGLMINVKSSHTLQNGARNLDETDLLALTDAVCCLATKERVGREEQYSECGKIVLNLPSLFEIKANEQSNKSTIFHSIAGKMPHSLVTEMFRNMVKALPCSGK